MLRLVLSELLYTDQSQFRQPLLRNQTFDGCIQVWWLLTAIAEEQTTGTKGQSLDGWFPISEELMKNSGEYVERLRLQYVSDPIRHFVQFWNMKPRFSPEDRKGVIYCIPCQDCDKSYIGETGRTLKVRLAEHQEILSQWWNEQVWNITTYTQNWLAL